MIPDSAEAAIDHAALQPTWKQSLAQAVRDPEILLQLLALDDQPQLLAAAERAAKHFPLRVPRGYIARMQPGDINDPLLRQVLPLAEELQQTSGYSSDPVGDLDAMVQPGLLHKYQGRVLLISTSACAIHCRYCFRREFPYADANPKQDQYTQALQHTARNPDITELILSGGDPLMLTNSVLARLLDQCANLPQLKRLRIHTRIPVVLPERIDTTLCELFKRSRLQIIHVIHANHAQEINEDVIQAVARLRQRNSLLLNQAVLLKGVNNSISALQNLSESLISIGVQPYYLHMLDRVKGTLHFDVDQNSAIALMQELAQILPGYMLPKLVREIAGSPAKMPVSSKES